MSSTPLRSVKLQGIVVRTYDFGETDRIIVIHSATHGLVRAVANGIRRPGSRFGGRLEPHCLVNVNLHRGTNLYTVTDAELVIAHERIRTDWIVSTCAAVVAQTISGIVQEDNPDVPLFLLHHDLLTALNTTPLSPLQLVDAFMLRVACLEGHAPAIDTCASCDDNQVIAFIPALGGALCPMHAPPAAQPIPGEMMDYLRVLRWAAWPIIRDLVVPKALADLGTLMVRNWFSEHVPIKMTALSVLPARPEDQPHD